MAIKPTKPTTPPKALRSDPATFPERAEGTVDFLFGDNLDYVDDSNTFVDDRADQALASAVAAAAGNLDAAQRETFAGYLVGVSEDAGNPLEAVEIVEKPDLTQAQVEDSTSTVMGAVSGQRLAQAVDRGIGQVGTYAFLRSTAVGSDRVPGDTLAGTSLEYSNVNGTGSVNPPGTWRCMGYADRTTSEGRTTLWLRIS